MTQKKRNTASEACQSAGGPLEGPSEPTVTTPLLAPSTSRKDYESIRPDYT